MAFKLRSGNKTNFKSMGSSPVKQKAEHTKSYPPSYTKEDIEFLKKQREDVVRYEDLDKKGQEIWKSQGKPVPKKKKSPNKQKVVKEGEGKDQNKIFNKEGEHVGDYVNGKKVMLEKKSPKLAKKKTPAKQKETYDEEVARIKEEKLKENKEKTKIAVEKHKEEMRKKNEKGMQKYSPGVKVVRKTKTVYRDYEGN